MPRSEPEQGQDARERAAAQGIPHLGPTLMARCLAPSAVVCPGPSAAGLSSKC